MAVTLPRHKLLDSAGRDAMIVEHMPLVKYLVGRIVPQLPAQGRTIFLFSPVASWPLSLLNQPMRWQKVTLVGIGLLGDVMTPGGSSYLR